MPGVYNAAWTTIRGNLGLVGKSAVARGWPAQRALFRGAEMYGASSREARTAIGGASRFLASAIPGAIVGAAWGAVSDKETILSGALKGAFVGGAARLSLRHFNPRFAGAEVPGAALGGRLKRIRGFTNMTQNRNMMDNVRTAWTSMGNTNPALRKWMVGMGIFGAFRGMRAGDDNPVGGAVSGALGGAIQGGGIYGGYRAGKTLLGTVRK